LGGRQRRNGAAIPSISVSSLCAVSEKIDLSPETAPADEPKRSRESSVNTDAQLQESR
jgi:hypothetical protein